MINFESAKYYIKLNDELKTFESNGSRFKNILNNFLAFLIVVIAFFIFSILLVSFLFKSQNVDWNSKIILYVIVFIYSISIWHYFFGTSGYYFILSKIEKLSGNDNLIASTSLQKSSVIKGINHLDKTVKFVSENNVTLTSLDLNQKIRIEELLNTYFEHQYKWDIFGFKHDDIIKEITMILNSEAIKLDKIELSENIQDTKSISPKDSQNAIQDKSLDYLETFPQSPTSENEFYSESSIHSIFDAKELFTLITSYNDTKDENKFGKVKSVINKNYAEQYIRNLELGKLGEYFVLHFERNRLFSNGQKQFCKKVKHVSEDYGDKFGYDILSFTNDEREMYIEVKTTSASFDTGFYLSNNEYQKLMNNNEYYIYRVYNFDREKLEGMIYKVNKNSFNTFFINSPKQYKVSVK